MIPSSESTSRSLRLDEDLFLDLDALDLLLWVRDLETESRIFLCINALLFLLLVNKMPMNNTNAPNNITAPAPYLKLFINDPPRAAEFKVDTPEDIAMRDDEDPAFLINELDLHMGQSYSEHPPLYDIK
jgi:hypothetical protein